MTKQKQTERPETNITSEISQEFQAIISGHYDNFTLVSVFFEGEPTAAISAISETEDGKSYKIHPLYVRLTEKMLKRLTDHNGSVPKDFE